MFQVAFVFFVAATGLWAGIKSFNQSSRIERDESEMIRSLKISDIDNHLIDFSNKRDSIILILFINPQNILHRELLSYASVLHRKYRSSGFEVIGVSNQDMSSTREIYAYGRYPYKFICDLKGNLANTFQIKPCCGGTVLVGKNSRIKFKLSSLPNLESLRQLIEKEILGKIDYSFLPTRSRIVEIGNQVFQIPLLDVSAFRMTNLAGILQKPLVATFFSSYCSICKSGKRMETLKRLRERLEKDGKSVDFIIIFSKPYMERDIIELENRSGVHFKSYISFEDAFSESEQYVTDDSMKLDPITIIIDKDRILRQVDYMGINEEELFERIRTHSFEISGRLRYQKERG